MVGAVAVSVGVLSAAVLICGLEVATWWSTPPISAENAGAADPNGGKARKATGKRWWRLSLKLKG